MTIDDADINNELSKVLESATENSLSADNAKCCFEYLRNSARDQKSSSFQHLIWQFVSACPDDVLCSQIIPEDDFWDLIKDCATNMEPELLSSILNYLFNIFLSGQDVHELGFTSLCNHLQKRHNIMEYILINLSLHSLHVNLVADTLRCIASFLKSSMLLSKYDAEKAISIVPSICFLLLEYNFPTVVTLLLSIDELRPLIIDEYLPVKMQLAKFLESKTLQQASIELKQNLYHAIRNTNIFLRSYEMEFGSLNDSMAELNQLNTLQVYDMLSFLDNSNTVFIKNLTEQLLFKSSPFPFFKVIFEVSSEMQNFLNRFDEDDDSKISMAGHILNRESLLESLMCCILRFWSESQSTSRNDMDSLLQLVPIILDKMYCSIRDTNLKRSGSAFEVGIELLESFDYSTARLWQLEMIRNLHYQQWSDQISGFVDILSNQVHDYVRHQRLLLLQKGTWAYSENPIDEGSTNPRVYFIVVSDNHANLLARRFDHKLDETPFVEDNVICTKSEANSFPNPNSTIVVPIKIIDSFASKELRAENNAAEVPQVVNISKKNIYTEVKLLDKSQKCLLQMYLDTKEAAYIWLDGLMLISKSKSRANISENTKSQIKTLIDLRKDVQLLNLPFHQELQESPEDIDEEEFYDLDTLKNLPNEFYYQ